MLSRDEEISITQDLRRTFEIIEDECKMHVRRLVSQEIDLKTKPDYSDVVLLTLHFKYQVEKLENWINILKFSLNKILKEESDNGK